MACTGRKWCHFISYNPHFVGRSSHLRMKIKRVDHDEEQIQQINQAVEIFLEEIEQGMKKISIQAA